MRAEKKYLISEVETHLKKSDYVILTNFSKVTVADTAELRKRLAAEKAEFHVVKNSSLRVAAKALGLPEVDASLSGPTAIVVGGKNSAGVAKVLKKFFEEKQKLEIKVGVLDKKLVNSLALEIGPEAVINYERNKVIMMEGQPGVLMYIVMNGSVAISLKGRIAERVGPGGVFGEMALVERSPRLASSIAETDCELIGVNRNTFLSLVQAKPDFGLSLLNAIGERARFVTDQLKQG